MTMDSNQSQIKSRASKSNLAQSNQTATRVIRSRFESNRHDLDLPITSQIFPTIDSLPASGLTPRLYDWSVSEHLGFLFLVFFISLFCCGSVRQIKLAIC